MLFTDPVFLFALLPLICVIFYAVAPRLGRGAGIFWLLAAGLLFYATWATLVLPAAIVMKFRGCLVLLTTPDEKPYRRTALWLSLAYVLDGF